MSHATFGRRHLRHHLSRINAVQAASKLICHSPSLRPDMTTSTLKAICALRDQLVVHEADEHPKKVEDVKPALKIRVGITASIVAPSISPIAAEAGGPMPVFQCSHPFLTSASSPLPPPITCRRTSPGVQWHRSATGISQLMHPARPMVQMATQRIVKYLKESYRLHLSQVSEVYRSMLRPRIGDTGRYSGRRSTMSTIVLDYKSFKCRRFQTPINATARCLFWHSVLELMVAWRTFCWAHDGRPGHMKISMLKSDIDTLNTFFLELVASDCSASQSTVTVSPPL